MSKYDFDFSDSDNDNDLDNFLRNELAALSTACLSSTAAASAATTTTTSSPAEGGFPDINDDDDDDDLELVRGIKEKYGGGGTGDVGADICNPLSLKPLTSLPPVASDDDDDDFETLRAIQRRFSQYSGGGGAKGDANVDATETKSDSCGESLRDDAAGMSLGNESPDICKNDVEQDPCVSADNEEGSCHTSSFPKAAHTFIEAIKKNRSCQKFYRSKLLHIEARMEELKELIKRVKTLRDFQVQCKKKISQAISQKLDARIQLISASKQRPNTKATEKNVSPMCHGPLENSHVASYMTTLTEFPLTFHRQKWSEEERGNLKKGIIQQLQEILLEKSADVMSAFEEAGCAIGVDTIISSITDKDITPEVILDFSGKVNWERLASIYLPRRSGMECEARWLNFENCLINKDSWTRMEDKQLMLLVQQNGINNWNCIAEKLKTNRTPFQCLQRYQRSLNSKVMKSDWSEDEDAKLRSAVESFGESNWQAVASALVGRTGTQCSNRWNKTLHPNRQRVGKWSDDEDKRMKVAVALFGNKCWHRIAQFVPGRTQVQCRERWVNVLDPSLKRSVWTEEEDLKLKAAIVVNGYCWSKVASCVPMRTDNQCLRRWKRLFPHEVPLLRAARNIQKAALISNFVDREEERPALGPNDFVPLRIEGSTNQLENDNAPQKRKKSGNLKATRSRKCRKRGKLSEAKMTHDFGDEGNNDGDKVVNNKRTTSKSGSKIKKYNGIANRATDTKKIRSKRKESEETGETETWGMPSNFRSRRPRRVRSKAKAIHLITDSSVFQASNIDDTNTNTTAYISCSVGNNDSKVLHDQTVCSNSQLEISKDKEVEESNICDMTRKQSSSKLREERTFSETTLGANSCMALELRTSSSNSTKAHPVDAEGGSRKRQITEKQYKKCRFQTDQTKEWEDLPLAVLFSEVITCRRRKKSS